MEEREEIGSDEALYRGVFGRLGRDFAVRFRADRVVGGLNVKVRMDSKGKSTFVSASSRESGGQETHNLPFGISLCGR